MKKLILTIIAAIIFLSMLLCIKNEFARKLYKNANYGMESLIIKGSIDNLFLGSSMFRQGIDIYAIEKALGKDSFILAYNGNQPVFEYLELKYLLDHKVRINYLYLDLYAYSATALPKISDERLLVQTDTKFKFDIWKTLKNCKQANVSVFWELFVTSNNTSLFTFPISNKLTNPLYHKGGNVQKNQGISKDAIEKLETPICDEKMNPIQKEYLNKIIDLANENNIRIVMIETPKWHDVSENPSYINVMCEYISILNDREISYKLSQCTVENMKANNISVIPFDSYNPNYFIDKVHLSSQGREDFSSKLY